MDEKAAHEFISSKSQEVVDAAEDYLKTFDKDASPRVQKERFLELMQVQLKSLNPTGIAKLAKITLCLVQNCECHSEALFLDSAGELWHLITPRDITDLTVRMVAFPFLFGGIAEEVINNKQFGTYLRHTTFDEMVQVGLKPYSIVEQIHKNHSIINMTVEMQKGTQPLGRA